MKVRVVTDVRAGASYDDWVVWARTLEQCGFDGLFLATGSASLDRTLPPPDDALVTLRGLARDTSELVLGVIVPASGIWSPNLFARSMIEIGALSGGRVELCLLPEPADNYHDLRTSQKFLRDDVARLSDHCRGVTLCMSGRARLRVPRIVAMFADEFVALSATIAQFMSERERVTAACEAFGRDPATLRWSVTLDDCVDPSGPGHRSLVAHWASIGIDTLYLKMNDLYDLDHAEQLASGSIIHSDQVK
jgi:alkanesulfonate monooxygenase SsuD/methylene tetrahydromethanopterin reductase-like flavin-dependent oxidoreductase (luciferase family)